MTSAIQFRLPHITTILSPLYGIPKGTFGRGIYSPECIILHSLRLSLDTYDAQVTHPEYLLYRDRAQPNHPSLHFAIDYQGNIHNYVNTLDVAWGLLDYDRSNFPTAFTEGTSPVLDLHPGVSPDRFALHIGMMSGAPGDFQPFSAAALKSHARLIAYYCDLYDIPCDTSHVVTHETIDTQFEGVCVGDDLYNSTYPYAAILAAAQAIIAAGGEADPIFSPAPIIDEFFGVWTVNLSRVSSAAYIS